MKDRVLCDIGAPAPLQDWATIDWQLVKKRVKNLRQRIYRATQNRQWNRVRSLTKLMLRSYSNLLLSVRRVTQENQGKRTAGIDGQRALTAQDRVGLVKQMQDYTPWRIRPVKRIYIPRAEGKSPRPLGIPTLSDRVAQAIVKNALEPSWEARFEANSYGFRPGRSCQDALAQSHMRLQKGRDTWLLKADIQGAFDHVSHEAILTALGNTPGRELVKQWLKAGYVEAEMFHETLSGTPQGGIISPLLLNIALTGLEAVVAAPQKVKTYTYTRPHGSRQVSHKTSPRYGFIRYADDLLVTAGTQEDIEAIVPRIEHWLAERGLRLSQEKTTITQVKEGVNFLGFHIRQFKGSCYTLPQKEKVHAFLAEKRAWLRANGSATPEAVIQTLNPQLRGWGNYYRHGASKRTFKYVDHHVWKMLWRWARKRHPKKGAAWIAQKYFLVSTAPRWAFRTLVKTRQGGKKPLTLVRLADIPITRHIKVAGTASPDDPALAQYWAKRQTRYGNAYWGKGSKLRVVAEKQRWACPVCAAHLFNGEELQIHHKRPVQHGGTERTENLVHMHKVCHQHLHQMSHVPELSEA